MRALAQLRQARRRNTQKKNVEGDPAFTRIELRICSLVGNPPYTVWI
jgi:hypothetical protein